MTAFLEDQSNWHLSGTQEVDISHIFDLCVSQYESIPDLERAYAASHGMDNNLYGLRSSGDWMLEPLRTLQPNSYDVFDRYASEYMVGFRWRRRIPNPALPKDVLEIYQFIKVKNRLIIINESRYGFLEEAKPTDESMQCLPEIIVNSWLKRAGGWAINPIPHASISSRQLIKHPHNTWEPIEWILASYDQDWHTTLLPIIQSKISNLHITHRNPNDGASSKYSCMRCFLDTRPYDLGGKCGDQFFVVDSRTDRIVYHIHDGDVLNLRVLEPDGVGEAMDKYCAHVLLRVEGRFDFLPWSRRI